MTTLRQIAEAQSQTEDLEDAYLRERGWQHTCDTPGSLWVWSKTLPDGRVILTSKTEALGFCQRYGANLLRRAGRRARMGPRAERRRHAVQDAEAGIGPNRAG